MRSMRRELQHIPPAPRTPRWPPVLWARWPLAFVAFLGAVYGGVITLMLFYAWTGAPRDDQRLDRSGVPAHGTVVSVRPVGDGEEVRWQFVTETGERRDGLMYAPAGRYTVAKEVDVDYLPRDPSISRLKGERLSRLGDLTLPLWRWFVLPGIVALLLWFLGVLRTRNLLRWGDVSLAELQEVKLLPVVVPGMLRVSYRFRDHRARERRGQHWVRARSQLGMKLTAVPPPREAPIVHDRYRAWRNRLVTVDDFVLAPAAPRTHAADAPTPWTYDP